ncbi:hypothetical protein K438DRAFT_1984277 [Mycena galopus ATCC 62051]|nr:hypothetical protein K438DRAFT_1984277 [Mycena galopus ATCC 62051]
MHDALPFALLPLTAPTPHSDCDDRMSHSLLSPPFSPASSLATHRALHLHISSSSFFHPPSTPPPPSPFLRLRPPLPLLPPAPPPRPYFPSPDSYPLAPCRTVLLSPPSLPLPLSASSSPLPFNLHRILTLPQDGIDYTGVHVDLERSDTVLLLEAGGEGPSERAAGALVEPDHGRIRGVCMRRVRARSLLSF